MYSTVFSAERCVSFRPLFLLLAGVHSEREAAAELKAQLLVFHR